MTARGQANLIGFAVAVLVVTTVTVTGATLASDALGDADRQPAVTHAAERLAAHMVAAESSHTRGQNVLRAAATENLTRTELDAAVPPIRDRTVSVSLDGEVLVERSDDDSGTLARIAREPVRVERRVRVERAVPRTEKLDLEARREIAIPDHTGRIAVTIDTDRTRTVTTVRAGGRIVLYDPSGLSGRYVLGVPETYPLIVGFESDGTGAGTVTLSWTATNASVDRLVVTVGA